MEITTTYILSQICIIISYILLMVTYQLKSRKPILILNLTGRIMNMASYALLSAWSGLAMVIVAIIRNTIFIIDENKNGKRDEITKKDVGILIMLYIITIILAIFAYEGIFGLIIVFGTMLYTFSVWQRKTSVYKILGVPVCITRITYNIYIKSIFGIILEILLFISTVIGIAREYKADKEC